MQWIIKTQYCRLTNANNILNYNAYNLKELFPIPGHDEIILDICRPIDGAVRYTAFILEQTPSKHLGKFAALIVPQGR